MKALVTGGARSGKSRHAQRLAESLGPARTYVATAQPLDEEMAARIRRHQDDRGPGWRTLEEPLDLPGVLAARGAGEVVLVDCLTLWLSNVLLARGEDADLWPDLHALRDVVRASPSHLIFVTNEVGLGVVPMTPLGRRFVDWSGWLSQALEPALDRVVLVVAGLPLHLKG